MGSALALFNGRIQRTQFTQSVQSLDARIKTIANEVTTGTYPANPSFNCSAPAGASPSISAAAGEQGTREDCIFLGKIINFTPPTVNCTAPVDGSECAKVEIYTVVGKRTDAAGNVSASMATATPRLIINPPTPIDLTDSFTLEYGTHVTGLVQSNGSTLTSALGLFQGLNSSYNTSGNLNSGAQNVAAWVVKSTAFPAAPVDAQDINSTVTTGNVANFFALGSQDLHLCLRSGNNQQKASITFKGSGNSMKTAVVLEDPQCP